MAVSLTLAHSLTHSITLSLSLLLSLSLTFTHSLTYSFSRSLTLTHPHSLSLTQVKEQAKVAVSTLGLVNPQPYSGGCQLGRFHCDILRDNCILEGWASSSSMQELEIEAQCVGRGIPLDVFRRSSWCTLNLPPCILNPILYEMIYYRYTRCYIYIDILCLYVIFLYI